MILPFLSPTNIRNVVVPYNAMLSEAYGGIVIGIDHPDASLLRDYLNLPKLYGCSVHKDWPAELVVDALAGQRILEVGSSWHYHSGKPKQAPVCLPWQQCCHILAGYTGKLRVLVRTSAWGNTPQEKRECILGDLDDLLRVWECGCSETVR